MTQPEKSNSVELVVLHVRVPADVRDRIEQAATIADVSVAEAVRELLQVALSEIPPPVSRNPWIDRAMLVEALKQIDIFKPSGYPELTRAIAGVLGRVGE